VTLRPHGDVLPAILPKEHVPSTIQRLTYRMAGLVIVETAR
jgi:hypothetical protein